MVVELVDDELQVSDAHKCAGKKVSMRKRVARVAANVVSNFSMNQAQGRLGGSIKEQCKNLGFSGAFCDKNF